MRYVAYVVGGLVIIAVVGTAVWVWRGERWALKAFESGLKPTTGDGADTYDEGMAMAMTAGSGTEWVHDAHTEAIRTGVWD